MEDKDTSDMIKKFR